MTNSKKWEILFSPKKHVVLQSAQIIKELFKNRGLTAKKDIANFLQGDISLVTPQAVGLDKKQLEKAVKRIEKAKEQKEQVVIFGDYDVDGITGTAILWETLHAYGVTVTPYIPSRLEEGYGLSIAGITNLTEKIKKVKLIITVDNGIVANDAVAFAKEKGIDVIITDHHAVAEKLPDAFAIIHTTKLCGAGVGWLLAQRLAPQENTDHLSLVALATVADLVPLTGANRILLREGLQELHKTKRPGLLALFADAKIEKEKIGVYEIGHVISPRLNAMGRLALAMDSLRLLCTKDRLRAQVLADTLSRTNKERQLKTIAATEHATATLAKHKGNEKLLFIANDTYEEGIVGLVAGRLVETFYLPAIVISKGEKISKASARSIAGFNIIAFIRTHQHLLLNAGGHPMAAGFSVETEKIGELQKALTALAKQQISQDMLQRILKIDMQLSLANITPDFYTALQELSPFGIGNPEPTFVSRVVIKDVKQIGKEKNHLKLKVSQNNTIFDAIAFGMGDKAIDLKIGNSIEVVYTIAENEWQGRKSIQLKIKDIK